MPHAVESLPLDVSRKLVRYAAATRHTTWEVLKALARARDEPIVPEEPELVISLVRTARLVDLPIGWLMQGKKRRLEVILEQEANPASWEVLWLVPPHN